MNEYQVALFEQQIKGDPKNRVFLKLAEAYRKGQVYDKAIEVCRNGLVHHPNWLPALICYGRSLYEVGDFDLAKEVMAKVLGFSSDNGHALKTIAYIAFKRRHFDEAKTYFETLLLYEPDNDEVRERLDDISSGRAHEVVPDDEDSVDTLILDPSDLDDELLLSEDDDEFDDEDLSVEVLNTTEDEVLHPGVDNLDHHFNKAIEEADSGVFELFEDGQDPTIKPSNRTMSVDDEKVLTLALKHERLDHYEETRHILRKLLHAYPRDPLVSEHLQRVEHLMTTETKKAKKIRLLSNFLDKVKGVYYVS